QAQRTGRIGNNSFTIGADWCRTICRRWSYIIEESHDTSATHIEFSRCAEYRKDLLIGQGNGQSFGEFFLIQTAFIEEFFHQAFIVFSRGFYQCLMQLLRTSDFSIRDGFFLRFAAILWKYIHHHAQGIYDGMKACASL